MKNLILIALAISLSCQLGFAGGKGDGTHITDRGNQVFTSASAALASFFTEKMTDEQLRNSINAAIKISSQYGDNETIEQHGYEIHSDQVTIDWVINMLQTVGLLTPEQFDSGLLQDSNVTGYHVENGIPQVKAHYLFYALYAETYYVDVPEASKDAIRESILQDLSHAWGFNDKKGRTFATLITNIFDQNNGISSNVANQNTKPGCLDRTQARTASRTIRSMKRTRTTIGGNLSTHIYTEAKSVVTSFKSVFRGSLSNEQIQSIIEPLEAIADCPEVGGYYAGVQLLCGEPLIDSAAALVDRLTCQ